MACTYADQPKYTRVKIATAKNNNKVIIIIIKYKAGHSNVRDRGEGLTLEASASKSYLRW